MSRQTDCRRARGFTLVEILIVVVVLGILAAIAVPKLTNASASSRESSLKDNLRLLRTQIAVYQTQHRDVPPGYPNGNTSATPSGDVFIKQMTQYTDDYGALAATSGGNYRWGPYLSSMPVNSVNGLNTISIIAAGGAFAADGSTGWLYQPSTGLIRPNLAGTDSEGKLFSSY